MRSMLPAAIENLQRPFLLELYISVDWEFAILKLGLRNLSSKLKWVTVFGQSSDTKSIRKSARERSELTLAFVIQMTNHITSSALSAMERRTTARRLPGPTIFGASGYWRNAVGEFIEFGQLRG